jgi:hypothetical protein
MGTTASDSIVLVMGTTALDSIVLVIGTTVPDSLAPPFITVVDISNYIAIFL